MFRFSIRDLLWLTALVALSVGWAIDYWRPTNPYLKAEFKNEAMEEKLRIEGFKVVQDGWRVEISHKTDSDKRFASWIDPLPTR
ncbi:MAG: hypothetical protein IAF94_24210 [Pirellulaceae bacterium]|nr:hypothetical protein [Pirellulaceae bacterium]